jgi:hypothetical protein
MTGGKSRRPINNGRVSRKEFDECREGFEGFHISILIGTATGRRFRA